MPITGDGFEYTIVGSGAWIIAYTGAGGNIVIPSSVDGYPVTRIGYAAFENNNNIIRVFIPNSVNDIASYAFNNCSKLIEIRVDSGNYNYSSNNGVLFDKAQTLLICNPAGLTEGLTIPSTVTSISDWAFAYNHLTSISIPNSVVSIGIYAFRNSVNLTNINIPYSVTYIGGGAFNFCNSLRSITVDATNINYYSFVGILFNISRTQLICYPAGISGTFAVENYVISINSSAFERCTKLTGINTGRDVTVIGDKAFFACTGLVSIVMGNSLNTIGSEAFAYCTSLTNVTIGSSINKISYHGFYNCSNLISATFLGNAPSSVEEDVFGATLPDFKVYYFYGKSGFTNPWHGYQTEALYIVTYNGNGNTSGTVPIDSNTYQFNQSVVVSDNTGLLQNSGHNFNGWNTQADGNGTHYEPGESFLMGNNNIILYAQWTAYKVSYNGNGNTSGTVPIDSNEYESGETVTVLDNTGLLKKIGYSFGGWNTNADGTGTHYGVGATFSILNQNVVLYVEWVKVYTIIYDGNGNTIGTVPVDSNEYLSGESVIILGNTGYLGKDNYVFRGWNTESGGSGTHYNPGTTLIMGTENVILYAQWSFEQLTILGKINLTINSDESIIIKDSEPELAIISGDTAIGTEFEVGRITVNTSSINNFIVKIDIIISAFSINFISPITFRVFKLYNNQSKPVSVGLGWIFKEITSTRTTFSFFVIDSDSLNGDLYTYKVIATIN